ncbi:hypothetical protein [Tunturiibacter gelidoferens]|uniref:Uncharacterized protein n=1 Tax=Tunturiibacter gelidiferens TaxID=3069689 RepID=A0A9X0U4C8_9BACT|nr:hypothetical protein [Edaphobacter lichenicola]MBB5329198.1 hypothetical protein [Edaphobacter lichenicola]
MTRFEIDTLKHGDVESIRLRGHLVLGQPIDDLRQKMDNLASRGELWGFSLVSAVANRYSETLRRRWRKRRDYY